MAGVRWTLQSADDLESITEFIARDSRHYASLFALQILEAVERIGSFPMAGRMVPEFGDQTIREVIHGNYRIIYRVSSDMAEILTVHHAARLLNGSSFE